MMKLTAQKRDSSESLKTLRSNGLIPAVCYGKEDEPLVISIDAREFNRVFKEAGSSALVELTGVDDDRDVLVKEVQRNPVTEQILHIDLYAIVRGETMEVSIPLEFIGESPVEKAGESVNKILREVTVETMPRNIPSHLDVDMMLLQETGDSILIKDIVLPADVTIVADPEDPVVTSSIAVEIEEETEDAPTEIDMDAIGDSEQKGKADEEGSEGEEKSEG